jgi:hypothetical protein
MDSEVEGMKDRWGRRVESHRKEQKLGGIQSYQVEKRLMAGMVVYTYNPITQEAEAGGSWVPSQPGLHIDPVPKTKPSKQKTEKKKEAVYFQQYSWVDN